MVVVMVAMAPGWKRECHRHPVSVKMTILEGKFYFKSHEMKSPLNLGKDDDINTFKSSYIA